ncbi:hypothetical protein Afil01_08430 [Actinorhabdospora filicis]|uniref:Fibronectin type-III domain-containing protein n=1 Tax=Actinorhabdospora filicis TaxID=1785913 RepID=A0A9W6SIB0_9ACTN|nr:fibronectin type III domain-containing protein [Actinorhabdospora filicis]GLZ76036.1 hypothetical protein Afil01_08430 [Actinorhabdospora filicis]
MPGAAVRKLKSKGAVISLVTTIGLIAAIVATLLGAGFFSQAAATNDAAAWLWTSTTGELSHVNGDNGRVDIRQPVPDAKGHDVEVVQTDNQILLRDLSTGRVNAIDPATLQITGTAETPPGKGVNMALHDGKAFIVDTVQGVVRQVDPVSLQAIGEPLRFAAGLSGGVFDNDGKLWFAVSKEGTLVSVKPGEEGKAAAVDSTHGVAEPQHQLIISVLRKGVAVLDTTGSQLTTVDGQDVRNVPVTLGGSAIMPTATDSTVPTITVTDGRRVLAVDGTSVQEIPVPGDGPDLGAAVEWWGRIYVADNATDKVYVFNRDGSMADSLDIPAGDGPIEMQANDGFLFVNAPHSKNALVIDEGHKVKPIDKGVGGVLGAEVPPEEKKETPPEKKEDAPGAPRNVKAVPGDGKATLSWDAAPNNGSAILKYVIEGIPGKTFEVAGNQQVYKITGLENGTEYRLTVYAVNALGNGPKAKSNPVVPTASVPDAPKSVDAVAKPDGTVEISWPEADGQGNKITGYKIDSVGAGGASQPVGETGGETKLVTEPGKLAYGQQFAFTVTAIAESGAASEPSPLSPTVVPFTKPGAVQGLQAPTVSSQKGQAQASWSPAAANGSAITGYKVTASNGFNQTVTGTSATITGIPDGTTVTVTVVAINQAGEGDPANTTAQAVGQPTVSISGHSANTNSLTVNFSASGNGGDLTCTATINDKSASGNCGQLTIGGLRASSGYTVKVTVSNAAGSAEATRDVVTDKLSGTVTCKNYGTGDTATYCNNGINTYSTPSQNGNSKGKLQHGTRADALCKAGGDKELFAYGYNNDKKSSLWIKINSGGGEVYIPWVWFNLDSGDNTGLLADC